MAYALVTVPVSRQHLKKLPRPVRAHLVAALNVLKDHPYTGEQLNPPWRAFRSFHTKYHTVAYRVIYEVDEGHKAIIIRAAGTRENFYKELRQLRLKPLASS